MFKALKPLNINWTSQASISFAKNIELMQLAADSGCKTLFFGLESVCETELQQMKKLYNNVKDIVIFGFDSETKKRLKIL